MAVSNFNFSAVYTDSIAFPGPGTRTVMQQLPNEIKDFINNSIIPALNGAVPVGAVHEYAGSTAPTGWLLCQGQAVSRSQYSTLFSTIGTAYGAGDGSTTFNLPNRKGKVAVGLDSGQTEFNTLGKTGGEKTHVLTTAEMPAHSHTLDHIYLPNGSSSAWTPGSGNNAGAQENTNTVGSGTAHNNLQPYVTMNYIIKF